uniref:4-hydroxy-3-methylbut-2-enyl diphosphate reductase n=1 Tax=Babesia bovis TaxID=5865 RepID=S6B1R9_BABBO|nr:LytB protein, putative [Babesia bovis]
MLKLLFLILLSSFTQCLVIQHIGYIGQWPRDVATANSYFKGRYRSNTTSNQVLLATPSSDVCDNNGAHINDSASTPIQDNGEKTVFLLEPRGFCAGVRRAIETVEEAVRIFGPPIYVKHEIVHNEFVCNTLKKKGVIFIEDIETVPEGSILVLSAHGVPPSVHEMVKKRNLVEIDASCPLVNKVHVYVRKKAEEGYKIILIGHKSHVETIGTLGEAPDVTTVVETVDDVDRLEYSRDTPLFYATQTTLSVDDCKIIKDRLLERFPWIETIPSGSICYATTNRQFAVRDACNFCDLVLVVGSSLSSNANRLVDTANLRNVRAHLIPNADAITEELIGDARKIALSASASTPDELTADVVKKLAVPPYNYNIEIYHSCDERVPKWRLPRNLELYIKEHDAKMQANLESSLVSPPVSPGVST